MATFEMEGKEIEYPDAETKEAYGHLFEALWGHEFQDLNKLAERIYELTARLSAADELAKAVDELNKQLPFGEIEVAGEAIGHTNARIIAAAKYQLILALEAYRKASQP